MAAPVGVSTEASRGLTRLCSHLRLSRAAAVREGRGSTCKAAAAGTEGPGRWAPGPSPPSQPRGGRSHAPQCAKPARARTARAALRRYKRPRSRPTRNPRLRPVPASRLALNPRPDRPLRNRRRPGPVRDARPGAPAVGTMGAAQSASEEIRELAGKTGCEYRAGHGRGGTGGAAAGSRGESQPAAAGRASRRWLCDLGPVAGPLCAQPRPPSKGFLPATWPAAARSQRGC